MIEPAATAGDGRRWRSEPQIPQNATRTRASCGSSGRSSASVVSRLRSSAMAIARIYEPGSGSGGIRPLACRADGFEYLERAVEVFTLVCRHHARADQRSARGDRRIERHVRVEALVPERLPELGRRDVVADHDRDDRSDDLPAAWQRGRLDDPVSELAKARVEVARLGP